MTDNSTYSLLAMFRELNDREFKKKLKMFPDDVRYHVILSGGIVGAELAKRVQETPEAVVKEGGAFVADMLNVASPGNDEVFKDILATYLVETLKDELRFCCMNCRKFNKCLEIEHLQVGELFLRRVNGEETEELKGLISAQIGDALTRTPYLDVEDAHKQCEDFVHQYSTSDIGEVFGRYSEIAAALQQKYGIDHRSLLHLMVAVNMEFCEKIKEVTEKAGQATSKGLKKGGEAVEKIFSGKDPAKDKSLQ